MNPGVEGLDPSDPVSSVARLDALARLSDGLSQGRRCVATGVAGSSSGFVAAALALRLSRPVLLVAAHLDDADEILDELSQSGDGLRVLRVPALEAAVGDESVSPELLAERLVVIEQARALDARQAVVVVAPIHALMQQTPPAARLASLVRVLRRGDRIEPGQLARWLVAAGYRRVEAIEEPGEFAVRGGIVDIFAPGGGAVPVRLDFFGDEIERLNEVDLDTMGSDRAVESVQLVTADPSRVIADEGVSFIDLLPRGFVAVLAETLEIVEQARGYFERATDGRGLMGPPAVLAEIEKKGCGLVEINQFSGGASSADLRVELPFESLPELSEDIAEGVGELAQLSNDTDVIVCCQNHGEQQRLGELLSEHAPEAGRIGSSVRYVHRGFVIGGERRVAFVPYHELLHRFDARRRSTRMRQGKAIDTFLDFGVGEYVVHADHGIAKFIGLVLLAPRQLPGLPPPPKSEREEYLTLEFAGGSRLQVPCTQIDQVQKYVGGFAGKPPLSTVGGVKWKHQKQRVTESVRDLAAELLRVRAAREHMPGIRYAGDTNWQREFEAEFPYQETEDQLAALAEIKRDMQSERPMDRLLCGDVGFGKTELAIRAAFKACEFGKQVAVLVPTTVLAEQHERTFGSRFRDYPFRVESLSRFKTQKEMNDTLRDLRKGQVDVIIGTHRLLSKDVRFADLGLVVIDEEQRFGVEHKERLLQLRMVVDVLTLSATPIPRTLHMAMLGLRDISSLTTPPLDRRAIVTEVIPYNEQRIARAIARELAREGQVYFVHNRVHNIQSVADEVQKLAPSARIVVGHGQMPSRELEEVMLTFMRRQADILVSTTIIESGIDNPTANTMIINDADRFGLADLHQLRGRVGRYKHRAYCYMLLPNDRNVTEVAQRRLKAIEEYSMLGAGFKIAMRDLEIRGAGNLLGAEQSGHIAAVGYEMYCRLLDRSVQELKYGKAEEPTSATSMELGISGLIPRAYIPSDVRRLEAYRRIAVAPTLEALAGVESDLRDAYGQPPPSTMRLIELAQVRIGAAALGVRTVTRRGPDIVFLTSDPAPVAETLRRGPGQVRVIDAALAQTNARDSSGTPLAEVYLRLDPRALEQGSLLAVLRARLAPNSVQDWSAPRPPTDSKKALA
ncbi:MAG: transcription-repair coupling factor [Leptolyngbya sp. PLA3]|nr:MAG: transcription-repair coupling factor [Cyanobacteria bacterium CYA]MCE7967580.1 transcription-repair coupling factor [Leptolyngbya sp. PL-A3]